MVLGRWTNEKPGLQDCSPGSRGLVRMSAYAAREFCLAVAAAGEDGLAGEPAGVVGGEEYGDVGDVLGLAEAAEWRGGHGPLLEVGCAVLAEDACGVGAFGFDHAGVQGVDANLLRAEL